MFKPAAMYLFGVMLTLLGSIPIQSQEVVINEFLASNSEVYMDPDFSAWSDWIELYNPGVDTIELGGYFMTDNRINPEKWKFPAEAVMGPGDYLLIWADGMDTVISAIHSNFRLSMEGEEILVFNPDLLLMDSIAYGPQREDISMGRQPDGSNHWFNFDPPSYGRTNSGGALLRADEPGFSLPAGFYTGNQVLEISSMDPLSAIRYSTNGDDPDVTSTLYTGPITLASRVGEPNVYSEIRTNKDPYHWLPEWIPPEGEVFKANVIRARAFREGFSPSAVITSSYFVDPGITTRYSTIPVISIVSDSKNLFDHHEGIYVPGYTHKTGQSGTGNYFQDWEKPAHIEFFEPGGKPGFAQDVGISIQGGTSPASPQKGLHVFARSTYGENRINYPLFENDPSSAGELTEFKRFMIRAWGSLITGALFNDAYAHRLMAGNDIDIQAYRPAVVFMNGEYWGVHALREANKNAWYYQYHHGIDRDDPGFDMLEHQYRNGVPTAYVDEGDAVHWNAMMDFIYSHDMTEPENYGYLKTQMDMENFIAYMGHCIYVGKWDWPNNNDASWRPRTPDGKWRWIQFDMETGFGVGAGLGPEYSGLGPQLNMFEAAIKGVEIPNFGTYGPHPILARIYTNVEFREDFIDWFVERFDHEFHPDTMNATLDAMAGEIRPYMEEYQHRWPFIGGVRGEWEASVENIREFNNQRQAYVKEQLLDLYNTDKITPLSEKLLQNYPNPFSTTTTIRYHMPEPGDVVIRIFNGSGQQVAIYPEHHNSAGQYSIQLDAWQLGGGLFFYSMESEGFYDVKKMVVLE